MSGIFISYRREDSAGYAGRLFADLKRRFAPEQLFIDVAGIELGRDFRQAIDKHVSGCDVLLVVIGRNWLGARDGGTPRLHDEKDFVRLEVVAALSRDIPVVPLLVDGAAMPREEELPKGLESLSWRNAMELRHARWDDDVEELMDALEKLVLQSDPGQGGDDQEVSALRQRLLAAPSGGELENIQLEVDELSRRRANDISVARLKRQVDDAMRVDRDRARRMSAPAPAPPMSAPRARTPWLQVASVAFVLFGAGTLYLAMREQPPGSGVEPPDQTSAAQVTVPNLIGMDATAARAAIEASGLAVGEITRRVDAATMGTVIEQNPRAGESVQRGQPVSLVYAATAAKKPVRIAMPNLVGMDDSAALDALKKAGLVEGKLDKRADAAPPGTVLEQRPVAGTRVERGTAVDLIFAAIPEPPPVKTVTMPEVVGKDLRSAVAYLDKLGLKASSRAVDDASQPVGTVIEQMPAAGTEVALGEVVRLSYVGGTLRMPDVIGLDIKTARSQLGRAGLAMGKMIPVETAKAPPSTVIRQDPVAGGVVKKGTPVDLSYAVAPKSY